MCSGMLPYRLPNSNQHLNGRSAFSLTVTVKHLRSLVLNCCISRHELMSQKTSKLQCYRCENLKSRIRHTRSILTIVILLYL